MIKKRAEYILNEVDKKGIVKVRTLSKQLQCSEVTIRNDIQKLEDQGLVKRIHGGAVKTKDQLNISLEPGNVHKNSEQKMKIAQKAYEYIQDQDTIILDDSSVNYYLAQYIKEENSKHLVVITNSLAAAAVLTKAEHVILFMIGGQIGGQFPAAMGELSIDILSKFHADKAFISAHGINFDAGITSIGSPQMQVKKSILSAAKEIYVLVDSSKFGGGYVMVVCGLERITRIITDSSLSEPYRIKALEKDVPLDIV